MKRKISMLIFLAAGILFALMGALLIALPTLTQNSLDRQTEKFLHRLEDSHTEISKAEPPIIQSVDELSPEPSQNDSQGQIKTSSQAEMPEFSKSEDYSPPDSGNNPGIGILEIDKIDLKMPVAKGVNEAQLQISACWVSETAEVGSTGNAIIAGHRNYTYGSHFNRLGEMALGDKIRYRSISSEIMEFEVCEILEVSPDDPAIFEQPENIQMLTLYTCTPISTATHRLLIRAERTDEGGN